MNLYKKWTTFLWVIWVISFTLTTSCSNSNAKTSKLVEHKITKKETLISLSNQILDDLATGEFSQFINLVHPTKGVLFSPYGHIDLIHSKPLNRASLSYYYSKDDLLFFGMNDGTGDSIKMDLKNYLKMYVNTPNYIKSKDISLNQIHHSGNELENMSDAFPNADYIEYYFSGFDKQYAGMDWKALRLVWENYENKWYLVGIVRACWTI